MAWQYMLNNKAHDIVQAVWPVYRDTEFTTADVARVMGAPIKCFGATMGSLAMRKVVERTNGASRSHYPKGGKSGPVKWRFTEKFKAHYEKRYLSERG